MDCPRGQNKMAVVERLQFSVSGGSTVACEFGNKSYTAEVLDSVTLRVNE